MGASMATGWARSEGGVQLPLLGELTDLDRRDEGALLRGSRFFAARSRPPIRTCKKGHAVALAQAARLITHGAIHERGRLEGEAIGQERGIRVGEERGLRAAIRALCVPLGIPLDEQREATLEAMNAEELAGFVVRLGTARAWP